MKTYGKLGAYDKSDSVDDFSGISQKLVEEAKQEKRIIEEDPQKLKHMIKTDLRDNLPAQLYALIGAITSKVEAVEKKNPNRG